MHGGERAGRELHRAREQRLQRVAAAGEYDGRHPLQAFAQLQHLGLQLRRGADRRGRHVELLRRRLRQRDELLHGLGAEIGLDREHVRRDGKLADRNEILERVVGQLLVETWIDRIGAGRKEERVAVRLRACGQPHADIAAGTAAVLHEHGAADCLLQRSRHDARNDVGRPARCVGDDDTHRPFRIGRERGAGAQDCGCRDADGQQAFDDVTTRGVGDYELAPYPTAMAAES